MAEKQLQSLRSLLERLTSDLNSYAPLVCKHFFSGAAVYAGGRIFMTLTPAGLALKLPEASQAALLEKGAKALRYFPQGPIKKDYLVVPKKIAGDDGALTPWIQESIRYVLTLPKPRPKSKKAK